MSIRPFRPRSPRRAACGSRPRASPSGPCCFFRIDFGTIVRRSFPPNNSPRSSADLLQGYRCQQLPRRANKTDNNNNNNNNNYTNNKNDNTKKTTNKLLEGVVYLYILLIG